MKFILGAYNHISRLNTVSVRNNNTKLINKIHIFHACRCSNGGGSN